MKNGVKKNINKFAAMLLCTCLGVGSVSTFGFAFTEDEVAQGEEVVMEEVNVDSGGGGLEETVEEIETVDGEQTQSQEEGEKIPEDTVESQPELSEEQTEEQSQEPETSEDDTEEPSEDEPSFEIEENPEISEEQSPEEGDINISEETVPEEPEVEEPNVPENELPDDNPGIEDNIESAPEDEVPPEAEVEPEENIELHMFLKRSIVQADDGSLRLRYEPWFDTAEGTEKIFSSGIIAVFPEGQTWDLQMSDPNSQIGYAAITKDDEAWQTIISTTIEELPDKDIYSSAVLWYPVEWLTKPESFVYFTTVPEGVTAVEQIAPVRFLADGKVVAYTNDGGWENADLLVPVATPPVEDLQQDVEQEETGDVLGEDPLENEENSFLPEGPDTNGDTEMPDDPEIEDNMGEIPNEVPDEPAGDVEQPPVVPGEDEPGIEEPVNVEMTNIVLSVSAIEELDAEVTFSYKLTYPELNVNISLPEAEGSIKLKTGNSTILEQIPVGTEYEVIVEAPEGYSIEQSYWTGTIETKEELRIEPIVRQESEKEYVCGKEEHTHGSECYDEQGNVICGKEEHVHDESCLTNSDQDNAEQESEFANIILIAPAVKDGEAVFTFSYTLEYPELDNDAVLPSNEGIFELKSEESISLENIPKGTIYTIELIVPEGMNFEQTLWTGTVGEEENIEIKAVMAEKEYLCGKEEHTHNDDCYDEEGNLICELEEHTHDDSCLKPASGDEAIDGPSAEDPAADANANKSYVASIKIQSIVDGSAYWDSDDEIGNDSSPSNKRVRSFDSIKYTLAYTTALMNETELVDEGNMMIEFLLPYDPSQVRFDEDYLNWVENKVITYNYEDGTSSPEYDSTKKVREQVLTGKKHLIKDGENVPIPGNGTLSVGLLVKAAPNGMTITPTYKIWMEGNEENEEEKKPKSITAEAITVTAAQRYNVQLKKNPYCNELGYFNMNDGTYSNDSSSGGIHGRVEGYGITIQLYNTSKEKGLKGIELPNGELSFDINISETLGEGGESLPDGLIPLLWDYLENTYPLSDDEVRGKLNRKMDCGGFQSAFASQSAPYNKSQYNDGGYFEGHTQDCHDGGNFTIEETGDGVFHVTVSDYTFDFENFHFPIYDAYTSINPYGENVGCFSAVYVEFILPFPEEVEERADVYFRVEVNNLQIESESGAKELNDENSSDNSIGTNFTMETKGKFSKENKYMDKDRIAVSSEYESGDGYGYNGQKIVIFSRAVAQIDNYICNLNILQKIDDEAIDVNPGGVHLFTSNNSQSELGDVTVLFAAKPDRQGWTSDDEMDGTHEEDLIYFDSIEALKQAGYVCVGFLYEVRHSKLYSGYYTGYMSTTIKDSAEIGEVYQTVNDVRFWSGEEDVLSWRDVNIIGGAHGAGGSGVENGYYPGYRTPLAVLYNEPDYRPKHYVKTIYDNGTIAGGHEGGIGAGDSLLIIGCKTKVTIEPANGKYNYDLDSGERRVDFKVRPEVSTSSENNEVTGSDDKTDLKVTVTIPPGMKFDPSSSTDYPPYSIVENEDGSTTVTWLFPGHTVGEPVPDIFFSCTIEDESGDVQDGSKYTVKAGISSDKDERHQVSKFENYSESTVTVSQLDALSIFKSTDKVIVGPGNILSYVLHVANTAESEVSGVHVFDELPYDKDERESSFHGKYQLDSILIDFTRAPNTFSKTNGIVSASVTTSEEARNKETKNNIVTDIESSGISFESLTGQITEENSIAWKDLGKSDITGIYINLDKLENAESVKITINLKPINVEGASQEGGDLYVNNFLATSGGQGEPIKSNSVNIRVVQRSISGMVWMDQDKDGIRGEAEQPKENITANLYKTVAHEGDQGESLLGMTLYPAYDTNGNKVQPVQVESSGSYLFNNLDSGTYYVVFSGSAGYALSPKDAGSDDKVDSDANNYEGTYYIGEIKIPMLEEMSNFKYESAHNDMGLYTDDSTPTVTLPDTGGPGSQDLLLYSIILLMLGVGFAFVGTKARSSSNR